jgi:hypothetical protein
MTIAQTSATPLGSPTVSATIADPKWLHPIDYAAYGEWLT